MSETGSPLATVLRSHKLFGFGQALEPTSEPLPVPQGSEVLLRITASGVCHSDLHVWEGEFDLGQGRKLDYRSVLQLPHTLGHEIAGEVLAVGPDATGANVGDRRVVYPWLGCGDCARCTAGEEQLCAQPRTLGMRRAGGFASHVLVPHPRCLFDHAGLRDEFACTCACSGLTAYSALRKAAPVGADYPLLIIGAGGVGQSAIRLAGALYDVAPWVAEVDPAKAASARDAGAVETIDPRSEGAAARVLQATSGGVAAVVDFVGSEASVGFGLSVLRKGGRLILVGLFGGSYALPLPLLPLRGHSLIGSFVGSLAEMGELMALARAGRLREIPIETRALGQAQAALDDLKAGRVLGRIVLKP